MCGTFDLEWAFGSASLVTKALTLNVTSDFSGSGGGHHIVSRGPTCRLRCFKCLYRRSSVGVVVCFASSTIITAETLWVGTAARCGSRISLSFEIFSFELVNDDANT
ncbi:hypothetical protein AXFE_04160 [Acidithrix ferrooxidans]|uniref:Uncharacterized protein n=1 Tax=Acidithrix ferrooxidans TaxID=1280514 RepID=A0A0D8HLE4_9ACTN|nr:hypothetical protein AXFE_04160 [Acidithrix ferrooxidans]